MTDSTQPDTVRSTLWALLIALILTLVFDWVRVSVFGIRFSWGGLCWDFIIAMTGTGLVRWMTLGMNDWK